MEPNMCTMSKNYLKIPIFLQEKEEILSSYQQIKTLCSQLRQRTRRNSNESVETSSSSEEILHTDSIKSGALNSALHELRGLVHDLLRKEAKGKKHVLKKYDWFAINTKDRRFLKEPQIMF